MLSQVDTAILIVLDLGEAENCWEEQVSVHGGSYFLGTLLAWHTPLSPSAEACHVKKEFVGQSQYVCA